MKFGGTSVGDATCIAKVVEIIRTATHDSSVVVVVSAMSGVTNKLVEAAIESEAGNSELVTAIFNELRQRHEAVVSALIHSEERHQLVRQKIQTVIEEGERYCQEVIARRELTLCARDAISGLGERLSAPLVAAALAEKGVASEAIETTDLVVTDSCHGAAEPDMELTSTRCSARLGPLLLNGVVVVVTGFIGATTKGIPTTLGRNSSDYSGTIMGAALQADEVTLWTDVDGILTADPKLVTQARSIPQMSYREAIHLADLGARVLHPKTLRPVMQRGIPLLIRNTFAPDRPGTKITPIGSSNGAGAKALTTACDLALISVVGSGSSDPAEILRRTMLAASTVPADVRLIPKPIVPQDEVCIVVPTAVAEHTVAAIRREFQQGVTRETVEDIKIVLPVAIVTVVEENLLGTQKLFTRGLRALKNENLKVIASDQGSSEFSISFVVANTHVQTALLAIHKEFHGESELSAVGLLETPTRSS